MRILKNILKKRQFYILLVSIPIHLTILLSDTYTSSPNLPLLKEIVDFGLTWFITASIWTSNMYFQKRIFGRFDVEKEPLKPILLHFLINLLITPTFVILVSVVYDNAICPVFHTDHMPEIMPMTGLIVGIIASLIIMIVEVTLWIYRAWRQKILEYEKLQHLHTKSQLESIKNQINPHFLFNSLSVLNSLIQNDKQLATKFVTQLSKTLRYSLEHEDEDLVFLKDELKFTESYMFLMKIRFGENLNLNINIGESFKTCFLPPMALQTLLENAIKHNKVSESEPLSIFIFEENKKLVIENTLQKRNSILTESNGTGLKNLSKRVQMISGRELEILEKKHTFTVKIPLSCKNENIDS